MIENGFNYAVEQAIKEDKKKAEKRAKKNRPERIKLQEQLLKNHKEQINEKGFACVKCDNWNKTDQKRMLKLMLIDGYKERTIKKSWNLNKL